MTFVGSLLAMNTYSVLTDGVDDKPFNGCTEDSTSGQIIKFRRIKDNFPKTNSFYIKIINY